MQKIKLPNGRQVFVLDKFTARDVYKEIYEENAYLQRGIQVKPGDVIFDVGANIGLFSMFISEKVTNLIFEALTANVASNPAIVKLYNVGLSDKDSTLEFEFYPKVCTDSTPIPFNFEKQVQMLLVDGDGKWFARITPRKLRKWFIEKFLKLFYRPVKLICPIKTISQIIAENAIKTIDLIKLDAENCEELVLQGIVAEDWSKIRQLAIEVHTNIPNGESLVNRIETLLNAKGFSSSLDTNARFSHIGVHMLYATRSV
jgi:FkbM family methyltransferase